jgi:anti-anti-sigma regulatory factor
MFDNQRDRHTNDHTPKRSARTRETAPLPLPFDAGVSRLGRRCRIGAASARSVLVPSGEACRESAAAPEISPRRWAGPSGSNHSQGSELINPRKKDLSTVLSVGYLHAIVIFSDTPPLLRCSGDEDRSTQGCRRRALTRALRSQADVIVDLTELTFADASLMVDLAVLARRLRARGRAVRLRAPQPQIQTLIEILGIHTLPGVELVSQRPTGAWPARRAAV